MTYKKILISYTKNLKKSDIKNYIKNNNYSVSENEINIIYEHIQKYYNVIFDNPIKYIKMIKEKVSDDTYYLILELFDKYKNYI